jgi:hypothetical protein
MRSWRGIKTLSMRSPSVSLRRKRSVPSFEGKRFSTCMEIL